MRLLEIRRYPIKSLLGERLVTVDVGDRGLAGDRLWAIRDGDGKLGSGKNTRRFRRMLSLFELRGHFAERCRWWSCPTVAASPPMTRRGI